MEGGLLGAWAGLPPTHPSPGLAGMWEVRPTCLCRCCVPCITSLHCLPSPPQVCRPD